MKKSFVILPALIVAVAASALVPSFASARRGADDAPGDVRREDRREDRREVKREDRRQDSKSTSVIEDNPNNVDANGVDLRGDGTPEDNSTSTPPAQTTPTPPAVVGTSVTREQAIVIAQAELPGKTLKKVENELEHGVQVWSVRFQDGGRVDVSQADGSITRVRDRN